MASDDVPVGWIVRYYTRGEDGQWRAGVAFEVSKEALESFIDLVRADKHTKVTGEPEPVYTRGGA